MTKLGYAYTGKQEDIAKVLGKGARVSPKQAYEIANAIRGKNLGKTKTYLEEVIALKKAVPYRRYNRGVGHKKKLGPGRYPVNASKIFLSLLQELEANSDTIGLNKDKLILKHVATHKADPIKGYYKGSPQNKQLSHIEIVAEEGK